jgi:hypothetical protein
MTLDDVDELAAGLPGVVVGAKWGNRTWMGLRRPLVCSVRSRGIINA